MLSALVRPGWDTPTNRDQTVATPGSTALNCDTLCWSGPGGFIKQTRRTGVQNITGLFRGITVAA